MFCFVLTKNHLQPGLTPNSASVQVPQVRLHAVATLERLADPGDDGLFTQDPVTKTLRKLLEVERNKDVRKCILGVIPVVKESTLRVSNNVTVVP